MKTDNELVEILVKKLKFPCYYDEDIQMIFDQNGKMICDIRGWGWIQKLEESDRTLDAFGKSICDLINEKWYNDNQQKV